jgi:hypothetical protein
MQQDGTRCGLDTPYEFLVKTPEGAVNQKELVLEFFGGGAWSDCMIASAMTGFGEFQRCMVFPKSMNSVGTHVYFHV